MTPHDAKAALRAQGIRNPSPQLIEDYMRVQQAEEWALEVPSPPVSAEAKPEHTEQEATSPNPAESRPHPSSESALKPTLVERGELERPTGRRKPGRPRVVASWFQAVATAMADGTPLREALAICGIHGLSRSEIRAIYRNAALTAMRREARQKWLREWGVRPKTRRRYACKGGPALGPSRQLLRIL